MGGISVLILISFLSAIFYFFVAIFLIIMAYLLFIYIFESLALMGIYKNANNSKYWQVWIPFYNKYLLGEAAHSKKIGILLALNNLLVIFLGIYFYHGQVFHAGLFVVFLLLLLIGFILDCVLSHKIFKKASDRYGDILTVLSVLSLGILRVIFMFLIRNRYSMDD